MNKKKFFATCTLVAFGATMVPAMAFATATPKEPSDFNGTGFYTADDSDVDFIEAIKFTDGLKLTAPAVGENAWLDDEDTLQVAFSTSAGSEIGVAPTDVSNKFKIIGFTKGTTDTDDATNSTAATVTIQAVEGAVFSPGYYTVKVIDKTNVGQSLVFDVLNASMAETVISSVVTVDAKGEVDDSATKYNMITVTDGGTDSVYDVGTDGYAQIKKGSKAVGVLVSNEISTENLQVGHTYALGETTISGDTYAEKYFTYTQKVADDVKKATDAAQKVVDDDYAKIADSIVIEVSGSDIDLDNAALKAADADALHDNNTIYVVEGLKIGEEVAVGVDNYADGDFSNNTTIVPAGAQNLVKNGDVNGEIVVLIQNGNSRMISKEKTVKVTLTSQKTDQEKMKDYATKNGLTDYDDNGDTNLTDDTAKLSVSKIGEGFTVGDGVSVDTTTISYNLKKYFDAKTGKVIALPEKDITETVKLIFASPATSASGAITVTLTIKAGDIEQPSDKEEAAKVVIEKAATFDELVVAAGAEVDDTEFAAILTAYMELLQAYMAYNQIA